jgi:hypothetical protein
MKRKTAAIFAVLAIGALGAPGAQADSIKVCGPGEPNPNWTETQKGSCNSSHDPVNTNKGGNAAPGQNR